MFTQRFCCTINRFACDPLVFEVGIAEGETPPLGFLLRRCEILLARSS